MKYTHLFLVGISAVLLLMVLLFEFVSVLQNFNAVDCNFTIWFCGVRKVNHVDGCAGTLSIVAMLPINSGYRCKTFSVLSIVTDVPCFKSPGSAINFKCY